MPDHTRTRTRTRAPASRPANPPTFRPNPNPVRWDVCRSHHGGEETSDAAHASLSEDYKQTIRDRACEYLRMRWEKGEICDTMEVNLGLDHTTLSPRLTELKYQGLIYKTKLKRPTRKGCLAFVWYWWEVPGRIRHRPDAQ